MLTKTDAGLMKGHRRCRRMPFVFFSLIVLVSDNHVRQQRDVTRTLNLTRKLTLAA